jgi:hypothetical protein
MLEVIDANHGSCDTVIALEEGGRYCATLRLGDAHRVAATPRLVDGLRGLFGRSDAVHLA